MLHQCRTLETVLWLVFAEVFRREPCRNQTPAGFWSTDPWWGNRCLTVIMTFIFLAIYSFFFPWNSSRILQLNSNCPPPSLLRPLLCHTEQATGPNSSFLSHKHKRGQNIMPTHARHSDNIMSACWGEGSGRPRGFYPGSKQETILLMDYSWCHTLKMFAFSS